MTRDEAPRVMRLFDDPLEARAPRPLGPGAVLLPGFALPVASALLTAVGEVIAAAPLRHMITPGGFRMTVAMTNCGEAGWVSDRSGYRYDPLDPQTGGRWPDMPECFLQLGAEAAAQAGFGEFIADACLINRYEPGSRLSLHQDSNERDLSAPIVSVSLGVPAVFLFGGSKRAERASRVPVMHGDVAVWGGPARLRYHGVMPLEEHDHPLLGRYRINLTLRKAL